MDLNKRLLSHVLRLRGIAEGVQGKRVDTPLLLRQQGLKCRAAARPEQAEQVEQAVLFALAGGEGHGGTILPGRINAFSTEIVA